MVLNIEEYARLREIEDEMEDIRRYDEAMAACERDESDAIPLEQARSARSGRSGKNPGGAVSYEVIVERKARKAITRLPLRSTAV